MTPDRLLLRAPGGIGEIVGGADLAGLIHDAVTADGGLADGAVLVVAQKIVSKAEGRRIALASVSPGEEARRLAAITGKDARLVELVLSESQAVMRARPGVLIVRHRLGHVMANAGIDQSNIGGEEDALLLPVDPDASAERLRAALSARFAADIAIIISDSFGRAWRLGSVNVAIGVSGLAALVDRRGERDRDGRPLEVTEVALADAVAAAAGLVIGEGAEGRPVAILDGLGASFAAGRAAHLLRAPATDLFL